MSAFTDWLKRRDEARVLLGDLVVRSGGVEVTRRLGTRVFYTEDGDDPENEIYLPILKGEPFYERVMSEVFRGRSFTSHGGLEIARAPEWVDLDSWYTDTPLRLTLRLGAPDWTIDQFGVINELSLLPWRVQRDGRLRLEIRNLEQRIKAYHNPNVILEGDRKGEPIREKAGLVRMVKAPLLDESNHLYKLADDVIEIVEVRKDDATTTTAYSTDAQYLDRGELKMNSKQDGPIYVTFKAGKNSGGTFLSNPAEIAEYLLTRESPHYQGQLQDADADSATLDVRASDVHERYAGVDITANDETHNIFSYDAASKKALINPATQLASDPFDAMQWLLFSGCTRSDTGTDHGRFNLVELISGGGPSAAGYFAEALSVNTNDVVLVRVYFIGGTSGKARIIYLDIDNGSDVADVRGDIGSLAVNAEVAGTIAALTEETVTVAPGVTATRVQFEVTHTGANSTDVQIGLGPFSSTSGENVQALAGMAGIKSAGNQWSTTPVTDDYFEVAYPHRVGPLDPDEIKSGTVSAFDTDAPYACGIIVERGLDRALDKLIGASCGGHWGGNRSGLLELGILDDPAGSPVLNITEADILRDTLHIEPDGMLAWRLDWLYRHYYETLGKDLDSSITESAGDDLRRAWRNVDPPVQDHQVKLDHPDAAELLEIESAIDDPTDAATEAARRFALRSVPHVLIHFDTKTGPFQLSAGQEINVTHRRYGMSGGKDLIIVGLRDFYTGNRARVTAWGLQ